MNWPSLFVVVPNALLARVMFTCAMGKCVVWLVMVPEQMVLLKGGAGALRLDPTAIWLLMSVNLAVESEKSTCKTLISGCCL